MSFKAVIASKSTLYHRLLAASCDKFSIESLTFREDENFFEKITEFLPEVVFLDESFIENKNSNLVAQMKKNEKLNDPYIIFTSTNPDSSKMIQEIGADAFLPIPFSKMKFDSILRQMHNRIRQILIVDSGDDISNLKESLTSLGFLLSTIKTGDDAMSEIHRIFHDLIICSYSLEDMSGVELCKRIKTTNLSHHIPVLIMSKSSEDEVIENCFNAGAQDVLLFPFHDEENINKIKTIISPPKKGIKEKALVIDDSPMIRNLIINMFKKLGFIVTGAENGVEGLTKAIKEKPDIITCDYDMPIMNGWEFCIEAKKIEDIKQIPIIMVTARGTDVDKKKGSVLGVAEYLTKPFKENNLQKIVSSVLLNVKKKKEHDEISKYVATDLLTNVSDVIDGIKERKPEEKFISVLFSDICSFTPKCERLSAQAVIKLLNSYFDRMVKVLHANNGIIDKFIGDAIVVRFDSGNKVKDAYDAVKSAYGMLTSLIEFNKESFEPVEIRIGINSGNIVLGNIGAEAYRLDYTMIGDNVNIGARLESIAEKMSCLISETTYDLISDKVEVGPSQNLTLKGKAKVVKAYPLIKLL